MKILVLYDYPPPPAGLATQGDLLYQGLVELGGPVRLLYRFVWGGSISESASTNA
jgi:hypothetical protein